MRIPHICHAHHSIPSRRWKFCNNIGAGAPAQAVQVQDMDTEADERPMRTLRRGDCCLIYSNQASVVPFLALVLEVGPCATPC